MQQKAPPGMWQRNVSFVLFSLLVVVGNLWLFSHFAPEKPVKPPDEPAQLADQQDPADGAPDEPKEGVDGDSSDPASATANGGDDEQPPEGVGQADVAIEPPREKIPEQWLTLGSVDPDGPYRMLVTLTNRGAAVARIELASRRFRDIDDRTGYLGHLVMDRTVGGSGAKVEVVGTGTPAEAAGILPGDSITHVAGARVTGARSLEKILRQYKPKQQVEITVQRAGKPRKLSATLRRRPLEVVRPEGKDPLSFLTTFSELDGQVLPDSALGLEGELSKEELKKDRDRPDLNKELAGIHLRDGTWEVVHQCQTEVVFRQTLPSRGLEVTKTFQLQPIPTEQANDVECPHYHLTMILEVTNTSDKQQRVAYELDGPTGLPTEGAWYARRAKITGSGLRDLVVSLDGNTPEFVSCDDITGQSWKSAWVDTSVSYIGVDAQYFATVLIPKQDKQKDEDEDEDEDEGNDNDKDKDGAGMLFAETHPLRVGPVDAKRPEMTNLTFRARSVPIDLAPGEKLTQTFDIFAGPKKPGLLTHYGLQDTVVYGWFWWVAKPMLWLLHFFHDYVVFNYGLAIILLTIVVRSAMLPLGRKQALAAQKMQELQPELKRLTEQHKNDMEARGKAQRELFRKHNYNPAAGCLPMFIQLPIFIGLYRSLMVDVELRQAPLFSESIRWCSNLAAPDMLFDWTSVMPAFVTEGTGMFVLGPYFNLLPIITVILFLAQQKLFMPPPTDDQSRMQAQVMKFMMLFMGFIFYKVASGLCLYFIASSLWGIGERKFFPRHEHAVAEAASKKKKEEAVSGGSKSSAGRNDPSSKRRKGDSSGKPRDKKTRRKR